jgi:hypothetical protein
MAVAIFAVFLNFAGVAYAASGGTFFLGQTNTADQTTSLAGSPPTGPALAVANTTSGQPAASFTVNGKKPPFTVSSSGKVTRLNADKLDGVDSSGFVQGAARTGANRIAVTATEVDTTYQQPIVTVAGFGTIDASCQRAQDGSVLTSLLYHNTSGNDEDVTLHDVFFFGDEQQSFLPHVILREQVVGDNLQVYAGSSESTSSLFNPSAHQAVFQIGSGPSHLATVNVSEVMAFGSQTCVAEAQWIATNA